MNPGIFCDPLSLHAVRSIFGAMGFASAGDWMTSTSDLEKQRPPVPALLGLSALAAAGSDRCLVLATKGSDFMRTTAPVIDMCCATHIWPPGV